MGVRSGLMVRVKGVRCSEFEVRVKEEGSGSG
jgi:hypothetical protein